MGTSSKCIRWYDRYPNVSLLMGILENMPRYQQETLSAQLLTLAREFEKVLTYSTETKSLGPTVVLSLYKSKQKSRWYDTIPALHDTLNLLLTFPEPFRKQYDDKCSVIVQKVYGKSLVR